MMRTLTALVAAAVLAAGCSSGGEPEANRPSTTTSASTTTSTSTTTTSPDAGCTPASAADVAGIDRLLVDRVDHIDDAFVAVGESGRRYIGANFYDAAGTMVAPVGVWFFEGDTAYGLSRLAFELSAVPDGRGLPGLPSAGDALGREVQRCAGP